MNEKLLSQAEFQLRTGVSRARQWQLRESGELGFYQIGGRIKYGENHVSDFLQSCEKKPAQTADNEAETNLRIAA